MNSNWIEALGTDGFAVVPGVLDSETLKRLDEAFQLGEGGAASKRESIFAIRNLLELEAVRELARSRAVRSLVEPILGSNAFAARGIFFDKTPDANWKVIWHQDLSIAVREKQEAEGFGPWSTKADAIHVQPPVAILEAMLTVRLHLDPCGIENGALRVVTGSHRWGRLESAQIQDQRSQIGETDVPVPLSGALLMRPLILHASSPSQTPSHRRVVHLEFAAEELPYGLQWRDRVGI